MKRRLILAASLLASAPAAAEPTLELYIRDFDEVLQGDPVSTAVDTEGRISLGLAERSAFAGPGRPAVALELQGETAWLATAGAGLQRVRGERAERTEGIDAPLVSAVATSPSGVWFATAPRARVGRVVDGRAKPWAEIEAEYVWALLPTSKGLLAATGAPAALLRVGEGRVESLATFEETHLRSAVALKDGAVVVGGGEKGIVYRVEADGRVRALYDSPLDEVTSLVVDPRTQDLYAAVVSGSEKGSTQPGTWIGPVGREAGSEAKSPFKSSEVVRIRADGDVDRLWTSDHEGALALAVDGDRGRLFIATGTGPEGRARVYAVERKHRDRVQLVARLEQPIASALRLEASGALVVATAPDGAVVRLGPNLRKEGVYLSVEQDLRRVARYGRMWFDADVPEGAKLEVSLRTGNTKTPDATWSEWSRGVPRSEGGDIDVPPGRYAQFRARLVAGRGGSPLLRSMHASVRRSNLPPELGAVFPLRPGAYLRPLPEEAEDEKTTTLSNTVFDELRRPANRTRRPRVRTGQEPGAFTVAWTSADANGDDLLYAVELIAEGGQRYPLGEDLDLPFVTFDGQAFPDGVYRAHVTVTDRPSNPPGEALQDELRSEAFVIDHGAPRVRDIRLKGKRLSATAEDAVSKLAEAQVSIDGGPWLAFPAADGMLDEKSELLELTLPAPAKRVRVRVKDEAGNQVVSGP